jgi:hypothetical protein
MTTPRGCILRKTSGQTPTVDAWTALTWQTEEQDTDGFFDSGSSTTRITIPSIGTSLVVQLSAGFRSASSSGGLTRGIRITKNGSTDYPGHAAQHSTVNATATTYSLVCVTAPILVAPGDYFIAEYFTQNIAVATDGSNARTFFSLSVRAIA